MDFFEIPKNAENQPYYEILERLMVDWESELVEFKEARSQYDSDKIGRYFSAISNEANIRRQQYGWLVFGVSETRDKHLVGTNYKNGPYLLEKFKYEIARQTNDGITFDDIFELMPIKDGVTYRVLMFKIPAAITGIPTSWKTVYYARSGESLVSLQQSKIDQIRAQERYDWSKQLIDGTSIECLDPDAIQLARQKYKEKMSGPQAENEINQMTDDEFLTKTKLMINGRLTHAALLLLGNPDYDYLFSTPPKVMWRLYGTNGSDKDYEIFGIPFINVIDKVFMKIRNLTYRYMPNQMTLFPVETQQYDTWLLRELLNNCIAHANYRIGGRIYVNEFEDKISITNPGDFLPQNIENVLQPSYNPPFYRNQLLADAMVKFHMIDTAAMGIRRVFRIQKEKFFPMPDYDLTVSGQVGVTVYGKTIDDNYMHILHDNPELELRTVFLLDQVQKKRPISDEGIAYLRKLKLVEGRKTNLFLSAKVAKSLAVEAQYIKNKGFDDQYYRDLIVKYLHEYKKAKKKDIRDLLWDKFPDVLNEKQKEAKIANLLAGLKRKGIIHTDSPNQQLSHWVLVNNE